MKRYNSWLRADLNILTGDPVVSNWAYLKAEFRLFWAEFTVTFCQPNWTVVHLPRALVGKLAASEATVLRTPTLGPVFLAKYKDDKYRKFLIPINEDNHWGVYAIAFKPETVQRIWAGMMRLRTELANEV